jgi:hypothetical protein
VIVRPTGRRCRDYSEEAFSGEVGVDDCVDDCVDDDGDDAEAFVLVLESVR